MGYEALHIMELLSVKCLQVDDVIPILSPCRKTQIGTKYHCKAQIYCHYIHTTCSQSGYIIVHSATKQILENYTYQNHSSYTAGNNIGITSSTCSHCTLSNSIMCSDSYPIPILSLFYYTIPYPLLFNSKISLFSSIFKASVCLPCMRYQLTTGLGSC